jgi:PKHD-type hydroxylase
MLSAAAISINDNSHQYYLYGFAEHLQFAQYTAPGGKYDPHIDCIHNWLIRKLSVSVQLSDENSYEGGDLCINYGKDIVMPRTQGMAIVFPSPAVHSVQPVTKGTRHSLVGWITGPRFK